MKLREKFLTECTRDGDVYTKYPDAVFNWFVSEFTDALPTKEEIAKEANSYDNCMASMSEATWMPIGFKAGAQFVVDKLEKLCEKCLVV